MEHKITLTFGYKDEKEKVHKDVTFGKRLTAGDVMMLDNDPRAQNRTQYSDLIRLRCITAFGTLKTPVGVNVLLSLNSVDREDITNGFEKFMVLSREERKADYPENKVVQICFGFEIDGTVYTVVEFGRLNTGRDEVEADECGDAGVMRECFLLGRMITKLRSADGAASIDGPVGLENFKTLDAGDLNLLRMGARIAEAFFRLEGKNAAGQRNSESGDPAETGDGNVGSGDPGHADAADQQLHRDDKGTEE